MLLLSFHHRIKLIGWYLIVVRSFDETLFVPPSHGRQYQCPWNICYETIKEKHILCRENNQFNLLSTLVVPTTLVIFIWRVTMSGLGSNTYMQNRQSSKNMPVKYVLLTHHAICRVQFHFTTGKHHSSWIHLGSCLSIIFYCFPFHLYTFSFVKNETENFTLQQVGKGRDVRLN